MRKFIKFTSVSALIILLVNTVAAQEKIIFESFLLKGIREDVTPSAEVTISSFSESFIVHLDPSIIEKEAKFVTRLKNELKAIYQLKDAELLAKGTMIWDGTKDRFVESVMLDRVGYFIHFSPEILSRSFNFKNSKVLLKSSKRVNLKILIYKYAWEDLKLNPEGVQLIGRGKEKLGLFDGPVEMSCSKASIQIILDTGIVIGFNEPLVLGFPSDKDSYFLSILITKKDLAQYVNVGEVEGGVIGGIENGYYKRVMEGIVVFGGVVRGASYYSIADTDPVCGKEVSRVKILEIDEDKIRAELTYTYKGKTYLFCSEECLEKFKKNPEKYIIKYSVKTPQTTTIKPGRRDDQLGVEVIIPTPIRRINPVYPEKCKKEKIEGTVVLEVQIDAEGNVINAPILKSVHPDLDKAAMEAIKKWKYEPVVKEGKKVPVVFAVTINFWLRDEN